ncbi:fusaric acid resistance protein|nr:fusaric acid resistance protein [Candidatus Pantoea persica]
MSHDFKPNLLLIINALLSTLTGIAAAVIVTAVIRNKRPSWTAKRALRKGLRELLQFITAVELNSASLVMRQQYVARTLEKVNVILPRKRLDSDAELAAGGNLITEAWLGANCYDFYTRHHSELAQSGISSDRFFGELRLFLRQRIRQLQSQTHQLLLEELNLLLMALDAAAHANSALYAPLFHLYNVRLSLFPQAQWPAENRTLLQPL